MPRRLRLTRDEVIRRRLLSRGWEPEEAQEVEDLESDKKVHQDRDDRIEDNDSSRN